MDDLLTAFQGLDLRFRNSLADEDSPLRVALAGLMLAHDEAGQEFVSTEELRVALEVAGVSVKRASLSAALARAGNRVSRRDVGGEQRYRLMTRGRREAEEVLGSGDLEMVYVEGNKPRTARQELESVLGKLSGTIRISDPYYGVRSLETLELIPKKSKVQFLTGKTNESSGRLAGPIKDFKRERPNVEMRLASKPQDLHDRYVLSDDQLLLVGHGLKDIGSKESFIVVITRGLAGDMLDDVKRAFDARWQAGSVI